VGSGIWGGCALLTYLLFAGAKAGAVKFYITRSNHISYIVGIFKKERDIPREQTERNVLTYSQFSVQ
jgi:hypothetical protein